MKPTGALAQDEMFPEGVDGGLMDMDEVNGGRFPYINSWHVIY